MFFFALDHLILLDLPGDVECSGKDVPVGFRNPYSLLISDLTSSEFATLYETHFPKYLLLLESLFPELN